MTSHSSLTTPDVRDVPVYIYALCEPETGEVRYVGKSRTPKGRLWCHLEAGAYRVRIWVRYLQTRGLSPKLRILREVNAGVDAAAAELETIREQQSSGARLLNARGTRRDPKTEANLVEMAKATGMQDALRRSGLRIEREEDFRTRTISAYRYVSEDWTLELSASGASVRCSNQNTGKTYVCPSPNVWPGHTGVPNSVQKAAAKMVERAKARDRDTDPADPPSSDEPREGAA